jgi:hypothetical protein
MMHKEAHSGIELVASVATTHAQREPLFLDVAVADVVQLGDASLTKSDSFLQVG